MDITIYLPNDLGKWAKEHDLALSRMLRGAVEGEKRYRDARAKAKEDSPRARRGLRQQEGTRRRLPGLPDRPRLRARATGSLAYPEEDAIAVYDADAQELYVYDDYGEFATPDWPETYIADVADALGQKYVEELDI